MASGEGLFYKVKKGDTLGRIAARQGLSLIHIFSGGAPMLGFLGTVTGMVRAFWQMANAGNNIDITMLSGGIYEACLVYTSTNIL